MKNTIYAFRAEFLKFRRTKILLVTVLAAVFMALMGAFMMFVSMHPDFARRAGMIGEKARLLDTADWPAFFALLSQMASVGGMILFGFAASWLFGREYSDKTVKDLLAQPVSRSSIVAAKFIIAALWCALLVVAQVIAGLAAGELAGLPGWSADVFWRGVTAIVVSAALEMLLISPVAFFASVGKGYLIPLGFVILTLILANLSGVLGFGPWFPWAIPGIYSQSIGTATLGAASYVIVAITSAAGMACTFAWWRYADQK
jgi:ABC-2 type transport system permease protein